MKKTILSASLCMGMLVLQAQKATPVAASLKDEVIQQIDGKYDTYKNIAQQIWGFAEVGNTQKQRVYRTDRRGRNAHCICSQLWQR